MMENFLWKSVFNVIWWFVTQTLHSGKSKSHFSKWKGLRIICNNKKVEASFCSKHFWIKINFEIKDTFGVSKVGSKEKLVVIAIESLEQESNKYDWFEASVKFVSFLKKQKF